MATFHFELVSPDKVSFSGEVDQVDVPGAEGDFGVLAGHAPEFIDWQWVEVSLLPGLVVPFKRATYERVVEEFAKFAEA